MSPRALGASSWRRWELLFKPVLTAIIILISGNKKFSAYSHLIFGPHHNLLPTAAVTSTVSGKWGAMSREYNVIMYLAQLETQLEI